MWNQGNWLMATSGRGNIQKGNFILSQKGRCLAVPVSLKSEVSSSQQAPLSRHYFSGVQEMFAETT